MLLERMKKGVNKIIIQILALLLIASFAVWGIGDMTGSISGQNSVASVDGEPISQRDFQEQFRREMNRIRERIGQIDAQQARNLGLAASTLDGMIARRLVAQQAHDMGLLVSDEQVVRRIQEEPGFRNALGQFDRAVFQAVLANNGLSEAGYVASLRQDIQQDFLAGTISRGVTAPSQLAETVYRYRNERRGADVIRVKRPNLEGAPAPTDADLAKYLSDNAASFMAPEYRGLTLLYLDPEQAAKELAPAPERIREEYEYRLESLSVPERRRLEQILLRDKAEADRAHAELSEGKSFAAVAQQATGKGNAGIELGLVARTDLLPDLADAAFALEKDGFSAPIQSPLGWHILRVSEIQPGRKPSLAEVEQQISADLSRELALDDLVKRANSIEDAIAGGASLEDAAAEGGAKVRKLEPIDPAAKLQGGTPVTGLPQDSRFIETAFTLEKGATSPLTETDGGGYFMVRVDEIVPSAERPLAQVREEVERAWKLEQLDAVAKRTAEEIRTAAATGTPLARIAEQRKLAVETGAPVSRFATQSDTAIPRPLIPELFKAKKGDVVMAQTVDGYAVARLTEIVEKAPPADDGDYQRLKESLAAAVSADLFEQYTRSLRREYPVSINQAGLNAFFATQQ